LEDLAAFTLKMEAARSSKMLVSYHNTKQHDNPDDPDFNWNFHCSVYLKSCIIVDSNSIRVMETKL
jgi:hypothetical protein